MGARGPPPAETSPITAGTATIRSEVVAVSSRADRNPRALMGLASASSTRAYASGKQRRAPAPPPLGVAAFHRVARALRRHGAIQVAHDLLDLGHQGRSHA